MIHLGFFNGSAVLANATVPSGAAIAVGQGSAGANVAFGIDRDFERSMLRAQCIARVMSPFLQAEDMFLHVRNADWEAFEVDVKATTGATSGITPHPHDPHSCNPRCYADHAGTPNPATLDRWRSDDAP